MSSSAAPSLERQLNRGVGLGLAVLLLVGAVLICVAMRQLAEQYVADRLRQDLDTLIAAANVVDQQLTFAPERLGLALVYRQPYSGHYFRVSQGQLLLRSRSLWDADFSPPSLNAGEEWRGRRVGPDGQRLLIVAQAVATQGQPRIVAVAEDTAPLEASLHRLTVGIAVFAMLMLIGLLWLQRRLIRHSLQPLRRLQDQLQQMERGERQDLPLAGVPGEILPLVQRLNGLLALLSARLERSRKAAGNLAHTLKTPLAVLTQMADDPALVGPCRSQLLAQLGMMRNTIDRELRRARLAGGSLSANFDLQAELAALLETLKRIYQENSLTLKLSNPTPSAQFAGDREDFLELMGVLLDNAFKWARSEVSIAVSGGAVLTLTIDDDGPGIAPEQRARLLGRGQRLDESATGAGLGLAIASDIVEQYQGELKLEAAPLGGLRIVLRLPGRAVIPAPLTSS